MINALWTAVAVVLLVVGAGACVPDKIREFKVKGHVTAAAIDQEGPFAVVILSGPPRVQILTSCDARVVATMHIAYNSIFPSNFLHRSMVYLYLQGSPYKLQALDIRDPFNVQTKTLSTKGLPANPSTAEVVPAGDRVFIFMDDVCNVYNATGEWVRSIQGIKVWTQAVLPGGGKIFTTDYRGKVGVYDVDTGVFRAAGNLTGLVGATFPVVVGGMIRVKRTLIDLSYATRDVEDVAAHLVNQGRIFTPYPTRWALDQESLEVLANTPVGYVPGRMGVKGDLILLVGEGKFAMFRWTCGGMVVPSPPCFTVEQGATSGGEWKEMEGDAVGRRTAILRLSDIPHAWLVKGTLVHITERTASVPAGTRFRVQCGLACEVFFAAAHCPPCNADGGLSQLLPYDGWEHGSCAPSYDGSRSMVSFRYELEAGGEIITPPTKHALWNAAVFVAPRSTDCSKLTTPEQCARSKPCSWRDSQCIRKWCPSSSSSAAPPPPNSGACVC